MLQWGKRTIESIYTLQTRAPTTSDTHGFELGVRWIDTVAGNEYVFLGTNGFGANWGHTTNTQAGAVLQYGYPIFAGADESFVLQVQSGTSLTLTLLNVVIGFNDPQARVTVSAGATQLFGAADQDLTMAVQYEKRTDLVGPAVLDIQYVNDSATAGSALLTFDLLTSG